MSAEQNIQVVQGAYAAFGRGDVAGILERLDDAVIWQAVYGASPSVPTAGVRRGKAAVGEFFAILAKAFTFEQFEPREFIAQGDRVVSLGHYRARTSTGKTIDADWVMVFTVRSGAIVNFQEFTDTAQLNAAFTTVGV